MDDDVIFRIEQQQKDRPLSQILSGDWRISPRTGA